MSGRKPWYFKALGALIAGLIAFCIARFFISFVRKEIRRSKTHKQQEGLFI